MRINQKFYQNVYHLVWRSMRPNQQSNYFLISVGWLGNTLILLLSTRNIYAYSYDTCYFYDCKGNCWNCAFSVQIAPHTICTQRHTENAQQKICTRKFNHKRYVRQSNRRTYKCENEWTIYFCMRYICMGYIGKEKVFYVPYIGCIDFCYDDKWVNSCYWANKLCPHIIYI